LSATTGLRVEGFKKQPRVVWGVIVCIYIIVVQGETMRLRVTVIRVKDKEVGYLLANLALGITTSFGYAANTPAIRGPNEEDVMPTELLTCGVEGYNHGAGW